MFCNECAKALCGVCVVDHHKIHTLEDMATLAPQQRDTLSTMHSELERVQTETQQCIDEVVTMMERKLLVFWYHFV